MRLIEMRRSLALRLALRVRWILCASHCASRLDNTGDNILHDGAEVEATQGNNALSGIDRFALGGGPFASGRLLF